MRPALIIAFTSLLLPALSLIAHGQQPQDRAKEISALRRKLFRNVEYPLRIRRLNSQIKVAQAEVHSLKAVIRQYEPFDRKYSKPFFQTLTRAKLDKLAAETRLKDLKYERSLLLRYQSSDKRLRELMLSW